MINRENYKAVNQFLSHRKEIDQVAQRTIEADKGRLKHCLIWADDVCFSQVANIRPTLPDYLSDARLDGSAKPFSSSYAKKIIGTAKRFLKWLTAHNRNYRSISNAWLDSLKTPQKTLPQEPRSVVTLGEVLKMMKAPANLLWQKRIRAAAAFLFLSGMRVGAFVSLPLSAVDIHDRQVKQWPSLGVCTKNNKHATTYLLDIPVLLNVAIEWDRGIRSSLPDDGLWFSHLSPLTGEIDLENGDIGRYRADRVRKDLKRWLSSVDLRYYSPHAFRHGHTIFGMHNAKTVAQLKAISQNLMHSNLSVTDGVYGILSGQDISSQIGALGNSSTHVGTLVESDIEAIADRITHKLRDKEQSM